MQDRTDHVLDAIDGAVRDWGTGPDAMRWTPEPSAPIRAPDLSGLAFSPEQAEAMRQGLQRAGARIGEIASALQSAFTQQIRALVESPEWQAFRNFAESAEGRAFVDAARRGELQLETRICSCLCVGRHPGQNVCTGEAGERVIRYRTPRLGVVDVAMCDPCLDVVDLPSRQG